MSGPLFITGHKGLAGSALVRAAAGRHILTAPRTDLDLRDPAQIADFLRQHRPSAIIHAAARNGGISLHQQEPTSMLADNLARNRQETLALAGAPGILRSQKPGVGPRMAA